MSGLLASAKPYRIKATHRRRRKVASGQSVQRYYDPSIGRFLSVDPVDADPNTGAMFNRYVYALNNPYGFTDPDGRRAKAAAPCGFCDNFYADDGRGNSTIPDAPAGDPSSPPPPPPPTPFSKKVSDGAEYLWEELILKSLIALGPPEAIAAGGAKLAVAGTLSVRLGWAGETAVRAAYNIGGRGFFRVGGRVRFPDGMTPTTLSEIKNVQSLSFTRQLRDYADFAKANNLRFDLYVPANMPMERLSAPLRNAIQAGEINLRYIPR